MTRFAVVALLPQDEARPGDADFVSREFSCWTEFATMMREVDERIPNWRIVSVCHVEDLPLLMEEP